MKLYIIKVSVLLNFQIQSAMEYPGFTNLSFLLIFNHDITLQVLTSLVMSEPQNYYVVNLNI